MSNLPMSEEPFMSFLQQSAPEFFSSIHDLSGGAEAVSVADGFFNQWTVRG